MTKSRISDRATRLLREAGIARTGELERHGVSRTQLRRLCERGSVERVGRIDQKAWRPRQGSPRLHLVHLSGRSFREGVEEHDVSGVRIRVYSAAKTVADCFKFRNKVGLDVAVEALRDYRRLHPKRLGALSRFAAADRVARVIRPYLEALG